MAIQDSGSRTEFESGAVRDIQGGKGRCDLMPLMEVGELLGSDEIKEIANFKNTGDTKHLIKCLDAFLVKSNFKCHSEMILEVAKHFEEGAKKYGENNWQKGIPLHSYIDSGIRHLLKFRMGMEDERHDRAFVWNILCGMWTKENKPELDDFTVGKKETE